RPAPPAPRDRGSAGVACHERAHARLKAGAVTLDARVRCGRVIEVHATAVLLEMRVECTSEAELLAAEVRGPLASRRVDRARERGALHLVEHVRNPRRIEH